MAGVTTTTNTRTVFFSLLTLSLITVFFESADCQQGQNFYINNAGARVGVDSARFIQFAPPSSTQHQHQQHPTASQEFANFFPPRTNGGPFSPFRGTAPSYHVQDFDEESLPAPSKYQQHFPQQQFIPQPSIYQLPPRTGQSSQQTRYDSSPASLLSPIASGFVAKHHQTPQHESSSSSFEDNEFQSPYQEPPERHIRPSPASQIIPRYEFDGQQPLRPRNRFQEPVAFSEVTRILQDSPISGTTSTVKALSSSQQQAAINDDLLQSQEQWGIPTRTEETDDNYRGRNSPYAVRTGNGDKNLNKLTIIADPTTTENSALAKNNNLYQKEQTTILDTIPELSEDKYWKEQHDWLVNNESKSDNRLESINEQRAQHSLKPALRNKPIRIKNNPSTTTTARTTSAAANIYVNNQSYNRERTTRIKPAVTVPSSVISSITTDASNTRQEFENRNNDSNDVKNRAKVINLNREESFQPAEKESSVELDEVFYRHQWWNKSNEPVASSLLHQPEDDHRLKLPSSQEKSVNFDVVTMSHDHAFVAQDNFKSFVDTGVIDKTETPLREDFKNGATLLEEDLSSVVETPVAEKHSSVVKKTLSPANMTAEENVRDSNSPIIKQVTKSDNTDSTTATATIQMNTITEGKPSFTSSTENWIVVSSVQTSRSISAARSISSPLPSKPQQSKSANGVGGNQNKSHKTTPNVTTRKSNSVITHSSTENIIDKLDQVQSDLSSAILDAGFPPAAAPSNKLTEGGVIPDIPSASTSKQYKTTSKPSSSATTSSAAVSSSTTTASAATIGSSVISSSDVEISSEENDSSPFTRKFVPTTKRPKNSHKSIIDSIQFEDVTNLLPAGYKPRGFTPKNAKSENTTSATTVAFNATSDVTTTEKNSQRQSKSKLDALPGIKFKFDDVSAFLPPDYKTTIQTSNSSNMRNESKEEKSDENHKPASIVTDDYKTKSSNRFQQRYKSKDTPAAESKSPSVSLDSIYNKIQFKETNDLLPSDYQNISSSSISSLSLSTATVETTSAEINNTDDIHKNTSTSVKVPDSKVVFPSRPGMANKKPSPTKASGNSKSSIPPYQIPNIQKGWPVRATTEFHGWSTPSASPISIEKLLQAVKEATTKEKELTSSTSTNDISSAASTASTTAFTTTPSTTTIEPTTPGICSEDCKLAGSIKLVDGVKWAPELLDHNTKEWKNLAREVELQLKNVYYTKEPLNHWCKGITIDAFSEGSVIVDYFVELNDLGHTVNTAEMKNIFNKALRELDAGSNGYINHGNRTSQLKFGKFTLDPTYIDFFVLPKTMHPAVGMAEQNMWLPQWAIAVIVIGIASLLFVIIFGITILVNKQKNALKHPTALTEDMLNELNKNHMSGFDNYGVDDLYNMEDVWNEKPFKKRSSYYHDGSMPNIYDSWRSDWNGYYGNSSHYNGSMHSGYSRRRSDYDTNF